MASRYEMLEMIEITFMDLSDVVEGGGPRNQDPLFRPLRRNTGLGQFRSIALSSWILIAKLSSTVPWQSSQAFASTQALVVPLGDNLPVTTHHMSQL